MCFNIYLFVVCSVRYSIIDLSVRGVTEEWTLMEKFLGMMGLMKLCFFDFSSNLNISDTIITGIIP